MAAPQDRVQLVKWESVSGGGDAADADSLLPEPLDSGEDAPDVRGLFIQPASPAAKDEDVYITRGASGDMIFRDITVGTEKTLNDLLGGAGSSVTYYEYLLGNPPIAETGATDASYTITRSGNTVTKETWQRNDATNIKTIDYTYSSGKVSTETIKVFAADGSTITAQVTWSYSYSGNLLNSATMVRNV